MARNTRKKPPQRRTTKRLSAETVAQPMMVPLWCVTTFWGLFLLPFAGVLTQTFFQCFTVETVRHGFWRSEEFTFFSIGALAMTLIFFVLPKMVVVYVFGHELTHAVWVWMSGGRVADFRVGREGGHILTDRQSVWIALAPYFYPIYSMMLLVIYGITALFMDLTPYHPWFLGLLGATWAFHVCFTIWMVPKGQTDLTYYGTFFSLVAIYMANLLLLSFMLILASPRVGFLGFADHGLENLAAFAGWMWHITH